MIDTTTAAYGAALLRVTLGVAALAHGLILKVFVFGIAGTVGFFESIGYPGFFAYLVMLGEIAGGLALITGVYARTAAVLMIPISGLLCSTCRTVGCSTRPAAGGSIRCSGLRRLLPPRSSDPARLR